MLVTSLVSSLPPDPLEPELEQRVHAAVTAIRAGRAVILVDDEDRENEGDLVFAAEHATPEAINFMAKFGRGLICLSLTGEQIDRLRLPMMPQAGAPLGTAFTLSIEAREGVTTGISAADRARTIQVAIAPDASPHDVVTPGHIFPLRARPGGVLVRTGQTEGSVDLARLAGLQPAAVICEIMNDDGSMARMPDLQVFSKTHDLPILSIADLIRYRLRTEKLVSRRGESEVFLADTRSRWRSVLYTTLVEAGAFLALIKGDIGRSTVDARASEPTLCRVHSGSLFPDVFGNPAGFPLDAPSGRSSLTQALTRIEAEGRGVLLYLPPGPNEGPNLATWCGIDHQDGPAPPRGALREFGLGAQVLADLGVRRLRLLSNHPRKLAGIEGYGLEVVERVPLSPDGFGPLSR
jgi:3,4-dihydroxy 2-butanone 4-phosphate synthase / GTP cyclohydrolase II